MTRSVFLVHERDPIQAEAPVEATPLTPTNLLFLRDNLGRPDPVAADDWELDVVGVRRRLLAVTAAQLAVRHPRVEVAAVLQCAGNGRRLLPHTVPGTPWTTGAAGNVRWAGIRVADLLAACGGPGDDARYLTVLGGDAPGDDPDRVERSIPIETARHRAILAFELNGRPIPHEHGGPVRLVVPGFFAVNSIKWVRRVAATSDESDADIQATRYRMVPPGTNPGPGNPSCWEMPVKSWVTTPLAGSARRTPVTVEGVAFSGAGAVTSVEVTADGGRIWIPSSLGPDLGPFAWRTFRARIELAPGPNLIASRATDVSGAVQPEWSEATVDGYSVNGWREHGVPVETSDPSPP